MLQALGNADLRRALDAVGAIAESTGRERGFAHHGVAILPRLVASELTTLSLCDLGTGHRSVVCDLPGAISKREIEVFDRHFHEHPLLRAHGRNPSAVTQRISDVVAPSGFRRTALFNDYYRPIGLDHAMALPIHVQRNVVVSFVFNRKGRDFADRERECLESIRAHLGNLYRLGGERDSARAAWGAPSIAPQAACEPGLTAREREVLDWLAGGKTDRDIGDILGISPRTVHKHLQRIYEKLGVETRTAAVVRGLGLKH